MKKSFRFSMFTCLLVLLFACSKEKNESVQVKEQLSDFETITVPELTLDVTGLSASRMPDDYNTFYGPAVQMGDGHLRSWINITRSNNQPLAIGIEFTGKSMQNLPQDHLNHMANAFVLSLHQKAKAVTAFDHITINWEPMGHEPAGIYNVPHFDMHFYKISVADQMMISPVPGPVPAPGYLPAAYVIQGATVPQMGTHWLNPASPELPPTFQPFTHTFIYGSTNGRVHFYEPMITRAFLLSGTSVNKSVPVPTKFSPVNKYYPSAYKIWKNNDNGRHYVALTNFTWQ
ncbi:MAG: hypothetical protein ACK5DG_09625 [Chitinophagaceae bacterium]